VLLGSEVHYQASGSGRLLGTLAATFGGSRRAVLVSAVSSYRGERLLWGLGSLSVGGVCCLFGFLTWGCDRVGRRRCKCVEQALYERNERLDIAGTGFCGDSGSQIQREDWSCSEMRSIRPDGCTAKAKEVGIVVAG
jgi:hypothetical protein